MTVPAGTHRYRHWLSEGLEGLAHRVTELTGGSEPRNIRKSPLRMRYYGQTKGGPGYLRIVPTTAEFLSRPGGAR